MIESTFVRLKNGAAGRSGVLPDIDVKLAVLLVALLLWPLLQGCAGNQPAATGEDEAPPTTPSEATLTPAEATAQADPNSAAAQFELGNSYYENNRLEEAVAAYKAALAINPNYQAAYANLGVVYYQQQQFELAATQYEKALELDPDDGDVAYNLGALYLQQALSTNQPPDQALLEQAVIQLTTAQEIAPALAEPHFTMGVAYLALNQRQQAIESFETFLDFPAEETDPRARQEAENYLNLLTQQEQ